MTKSIKELKKENAFLKSKCDKSDVTLIELVEEVKFISFHSLELLSIPGRGYVELILIFSRVAWANQETIGEDKKSERKARIIVPITSSREEAKLHRGQQLKFLTSSNVNLFLQNMKAILWLLSKSYSAFPLFFSREDAVRQRMAESPREKFGIWV